MRGAALPVLIVLMALMSALVSSVWRSAITRESLAQADADRLQARQAARALIREAQRDIQAPTPDLRHSPGPSGSIHAFFPRERQEWSELVSRLQPLPGLPCQQGICLALPVAEPAGVIWSSRLSAAATPGQFVARPLSSGSDRAMAQLFPATAVYWVEVLPFNSETAAASALIDVTPGDTALIYRITAYAQGAWPGTRVVQQVLWLASTSAPERAQASRVLQWREWLE